MMVGLNPQQQQHVVNHCYLYRSLTWTGVFVFAAVCEQLASNVAVRDPPLLLFVILMKQCIPPGDCRIL